MALGQRIYKETITRTLRGDEAPHRERLMAPRTKSTTDHVVETTQVVPVPISTDAFKGEAKNEHDPCFD